jgi:hypothetical protein
MQTVCVETTIMIKDPIVEEVRAAREKLFDACGRNLDTLLNHLKRTGAAGPVSRGLTRNRKGQAKPR